MGYFFSRCIFRVGKGKNKLYDYRVGLEIYLIRDILYLHVFIWGGVGFIFAVFRGAVVGFIFHKSLVFTRAKAEAQA